jgi:hypothetical protein
VSLSTAWFIVSKEQKSWPERMLDLNWQWVSWHRVVRETRRGNAFEDEERARSALGSIP